MELMKMMLLLLLPIASSRMTLLIGQVVDDHYRLCRLYVDDTRSFLRVELSSDVRSEARCDRYSSINPRRRRA
jgi:hypothetical protein